MNGSRRAQCGQPYQKNSMTSILPPPSVGCGGFMRPKSGCWAEAPAAAKPTAAMAVARSWRSVIMGGFLFLGVFGGADDGCDDAIVGQCRLDSVGVIHALVRPEPPTVQ